MNFCLVIVLHWTVLVKMCSTFDLQFLFNGMLALLALIIQTLIIHGAQLASSLQLTVSIHHFGAQILPVDLLEGIVFMSHFWHCTYS